MNKEQQKARNKKLVIIILGPPGGGKGTQAGLLAERMKLYYFETSKIIEESFNKKQKKRFIKVKGEKYYFSNEKKLWESGILCSPPFVSELVKTKVKELYKTGQNLILAGSPRTLYEGKHVLPLLKKLYGSKNIKTILIKQDAEVSIWRNTRRRICELMRHPIIYTEETARLVYCPLDGSKLLRRKGLDDPETIKVRIKQYEERTLPLIDFSRKQGLKIKEINGAQLVAKVFKDILRALK